MTKTTYSFFESGVIPGIPRDQGGEGHAGQNIEVEDGVVVNSYLRDAPVVEEESVTPPVEEPAPTTDYTTQPLIEEPAPQEEQLPFPNEEVIPPASVETPTEQPQEGA